VGIASLLHGPLRARHRAAVVIVVAPASPTQLDANTQDVAVGDYARDGVDL
jgi:hypothetical protein